jgi:hypothetical protein
MISVTMVVTKLLTNGCSTVIIVPEVVTTEWVPLSVLPDLDNTFWIRGKSDIIVTASSWFRGRWLWLSCIMITDSWSVSSSGT